MKNETKPISWNNSLRGGAIILACALLAGGCGLGKRLTTQSLLRPQDQGATMAHSDSGPTLRLIYGQGETPGVPINEFMYFVPLISPEPVTINQTAGNTQRAHITSVARQFSEEDFSVVCKFEFSGEGRQENVFDHSKLIRRKERQLKEGNSLKRQLGSISVEGAGSGKLEVKGTIANGVPTVSEVRLRFNANGQPSPISIGIHDIQYQSGQYQRTNEMVARVNTLMFRREPGRPKMHVTVASLKQKNAGTGFWQNAVGAVKGMAVNLIIKPIDAEKVGHTAMLDFGLALAEENPTFTFPKAHNLMTAKTRVP